MHLDWGIKLSLLMYVAGAPGGRLETDGVAGTGNAFHYPLDQDRTPAASADATAYAFTGSVRFWGHFGSFVADVADPEVRPAGEDAGSDWAMSILDRETGVRTAAFRLAGAPDRTEEGRLAWDTVELTEDGAKLFGGSYKAGTRFDPVAIVL